MTENVASLTETPTLEEKDPIFLYPDEALCFLSHIQGQPCEGLFALIACLALRKMEACRLKESDLYYQTVNGQRVWMLRVGGTKTRASDRKLPVPEVLVAYLARQRERNAVLRELAGEGWKEQGYLFPNARGSHISRQTPNDWLAKALKDLPVEPGREGLRDMTVHGLRRSCASILLALGVPLQTIALILGHSDTEITKIYALVSPTLKMDAFDKLSRFLRGEGSK